MDPPYNKGLWKPVLRKLEEHNLIADNGIIILEVAKDEEIELRGYTIAADKNWGAARVLFLKNS